MSVPIGESLSLPGELFTCAGFSKAGIEGSANHDNYFMEPSLNAAGVFDGMGREERAIDASQIAATKVATYIRARGNRELPAELATNALLFAHQSINQYIATTPDCPEIGTTAAVCLLHRDEAGDVQATTAHAGDSRIYRLHGEELTHLTVDHGIGDYDGHDEAYAAQLAIASALSVVALDENQNGVFIRRNIVTSYLGHDSPPPYIDTTTHAVAPGDRILLTTDAIPDNLVTEQIRNTLLEHSGDDAGAAYGLIDLCQDIKAVSPFRKHVDDMTAVVLTVTD